jgi:hypothetical protein
LFSLACPGLGLGSDIVAPFILMSPCQCYGYLILLVWRIGFGVTGLKLRSVDSDGSGLCPVDSGSLWQLSYPNLRIGSWSDHL